MRKAPLKKVLEKTSDTMIDLGKASIIAGFASLFIKPVNWFYVIGGTLLGLLLIGGGLRIA
jgi:hypothetical protein